jgi:hypothetical protein
MIDKLNIDDVAETYKADPEDDPEFRAFMRQYERPAKPLPPKNWPGTLSSGEFLRSYEAPAYIINRMAQQGYLYTITGVNSSGKTFVALRMAADVALGRNFGGKRTTQGAVLYLAGENYTDVQSRWAALAEQLRFDPETIPVHFVPGRFDLKEHIAPALQRIEELGNVRLVIVDTAQAFYTGDEENNNQQQIDFATTLRKMCTPKMRPAVVVLAHPKKGTDPRAFPIEPRGGSGLLNEIDGNWNLIKVSKDPMVTELRCTDKHRGREFDTIPFRLDLVWGPFTDAEGNELSSRVALPLDDAGEAALAKEVADDDAELLKAMKENDGASLNALATILGDGWTKSKVQRKVEKFAKTDPPQTVKGADGAWHLAGTS